MHCFMCDVIIYPCINLYIWIDAWMSNYILLFCMDLVTYSLPNPDAGLDNLCWLISA